jgi:hypothetical protein
MFTAFLKRAVSYGNNLRKNQGRIEKDSTTMLVPMGRLGLAYGPSGAWTLLPILVIWHPVSKLFASERLVANNWYQSHSILGILPNPTPNQPQIQTLRHGSECLAHD